MTRLEIIKIVRKLVIKGQVEKALAALYAYTEGVDKELESDIVLLQSNSTINQEQYEIKQIITKQEHDLTRSRTILAIENLLNKLPLQSTNNISAEIFEAQNEGLHDIKTLIPRWVWATIGIVALAIITFFVVSQNTPKNVVQPTAIVQKEESNFMGEWSANVTKKGYYVERGLKKYFENASATWSHVLQLAVAIGGAREAVQRVVTDVQLHDSAAKTLEPRRLSGDLHARRDRRGARGRRALAAVNLDDAEAAGTERIEGISGTQLRHVDTTDGGGTHDRRALLDEHLATIDGQRHRRQAALARAVRRRSTHVVFCGLGTGEFPDRFVAEEGEAQCHE